MIMKYFVDNVLNNYRSLHLSVITHAISYRLCKPERVPICHIITMWRKILLFLHGGLSIFKLGKPRPDLHCNFLQKLFHFATQRLLKVYVPVKYQGKLKLFSLYILSLYFAWKKPEKKF